MNILGISGSLRDKSLNTRLLEAASRILEARCAMEIYVPDDLPLYNAEDDDADKPDPVVQLKSRIAAADGLVVATPEYNYGIPGVLKNAIDWASRPAFESPLAEKPVAIMSASPAKTGGVRAQAHLKQVFAGTLSPVYPAPEFVLMQAHKMFDESGQLTDDESRERLKEFVNGFVDWINSRDC